MESAEKVAVFTHVVQESIKRTKEFGCTEKLFDLWSNSINHSVSRNSRMDIINNWTEIFKLLANSPTEQLHLHVKLPVCFVTYIDFIDSLTHFRIIDY